MKAASVGAMLLGLSAVLGLAPTGTALEAEAALDAEEQALLTLINGYRQDNGLGSLSVSNELADAAEWMSNDLASNDYMSHTDSLGRDPFQRMGDFGYDPGTAKAENLAAGVETAQGVFALWKSSPAHDPNMRNGDFKVIGIARAYSASSGAYGWYWVTDFGGEEASPSQSQAGVARAAPAATTAPTLTATATPTTEITPPAADSVTSTPAARPTISPTLANMREPGLRCLSFNSSRTICMAIAASALV